MNESSRDNPYNPPNAEMEETQDRPSTLPGKARICLGIATVAQLPVLASSLSTTPATNVQFWVGVVCGGVSITLFGFAAVMERFPFVRS